MKGIIQREYFIFKHNIILYLCVWTLIPMIVYLFISIPFSFYIKLSNGINYLNWSSVGNWISTSSIITFAISMSIANRYRESTNFSRTMLCTPTSNREHLSAIIIWSSGIGIIQLLFSLLITLSFKSANLFALDIFLVIIYIIPIIVLISNIGFLIGLSFETQLVRIIISLFLLMFIFFSSGLFVPLNESLPSIFTLSPLYLSVQNIQSIMMNDSSMISSSFILLLIAMIIFIINLVITSKVFKS